MLEPYDDSIVKEIQYLLDMDEEGSGVFGPWSNEDVGQAEHELGVTFPQSYRIFLLNFGVAVMRGFRVAGLDSDRMYIADLYDQGSRPESSPYTNVVSSTKLYREDRFGSDNIPKHYVYLSTDDGAVAFFLDLSRPDSRGECPVVIWGPGYEGNEVVASDFMDFLRRVANDFDVWPK